MRRGRQGQRRVASTAKRSPRPRGRGAQTWALYAQSLVVQHGSLAPSARPTPKSSPFGVANMASAPVMSSSELLTLVLHGLDYATAPTPAFNLHDHFMLAGAIVAASAITDQNATTVEVGSFAGHTAQYQAALLRKLGMRGQAALVHAVDSALLALNFDYGLRRNIEAFEQHHPELKDSIRLHQVPSKMMKPWSQPLRLFFEDSFHTYKVTGKSFNVFESSVVKGARVPLSPATVSV